MNEEDLAAWDLVTRVPKLSNVWAYVCGFLNLVLPGTGTILSSILGSPNINKTQMMVGIFQFLTAVTLIGFIWSIYWAYLIVAESSGDHSEIKKLLGGQANSNAQTNMRIENNGRRLNPHEVDDV